MNHTKDSKVLKSFYELVCLAIDEKGVYPQLGYARHQDGTNTMLSYMMDGPGVFKTVSLLMRDEAKQVVEMAFAVDRVTREGQGTEFADVLTGGWWDGVKWVPFVINYRNEPRIVREIDWDNTFWNAIMQESFSRMWPSRQPGWGAGLPLGRIGHLEG